MSNSLYPLDYNLPDSFVYEILQARILGWVCHCFFQGIFLTQGSNPGLQHYRQIFYQLSHIKCPYRMLYIAIAAVRDGFLKRSTCILLHASMSVL